MKKMLLLLVSGLLIACMAGSAMASEIVLLNEDGTQISDGSTVEMNIGDTLTVSPKFTYDGTDTGITGKVTPYTIKKSAIGSANVNNIDVMASTFTLPAGQNTFVDHNAVQIKLLGGKNGDSYQIGIGDLDVTLVMASVKTTTIPEFPTVAAPIAAILGLVFIFGRKKEGL